ncbi:MAG: hypothetical protein V1644_00410 [Candidatus Micrarchaeota archaeon]
MVLTLEKLNRSLDKFDTNEGKLHFLLAVYKKMTPAARRVAYAPENEKRVTKPLPLAVARQVGVLIHKYLPEVIARHANAGRSDLIVKLARASDKRLEGARLLVNVEPSYAAILFDEAKAHKEGGQALELYPTLAASLYAKGGHFKEAARAARISGNNSWAASLYEAAGLHKEAKALYESEGLLGHAARMNRKLRKPTERRA